MNILLLTNTMKQPDDTFAGRTDVVFYFAKVWAQNGHNVVVIHSESRFPVVFYHLPKFVYAYLQKKGNVAIPSVSSRNRLERISDGVRILRIPMGKCIPHAPFKEKQYRAQTAIIIDYLKQIDFKPDVITGHWLEPQLRLINDLGDFYSAKTGFVFHGDLPDTLSERYKEYIKKINCLFFRSDVSKRRAVVGQLKACLPQNVSVCYSGIPEQYLDEYTVRTNWKANGIFRVVYVGRLVRYKRIDSIIRALSEAFPCGGFHFDIIGEGTEWESLENLSRELKVDTLVTFHGRISRDEVQNKLKVADCFAMISENEVFGLVYLEAMASGCITIASLNGGVDGIIKDRKNGYLCEQGNSKDLSRVIKEISALNSNEVIAIRTNAIDTVKEYTDSKVAKRYLFDILNN